MTSDKACYWLALVIVILGVSGQFGNRTGNWPLNVIQRSAHGAARLADSISNHLNTAATRFDHRVNSAEGLAQARAARAQARAVCVNAAVGRRATERLNGAVARLNARMARLQASQASQ